ncbi:MAG: CDP-alcohol phosphatidyltransferase family protein [Clostridia bacterium]|nr:CDP-alcohol phosphatidyltransferase family protein [Clostridia bacterium]
MKRFIGVYDYTVVLTYLSLAAALAGIILAARGLFAAAVACVLLSGFLDAFDGAVARTKKDRTEDEKSFGIQLDSICDVIAFGVTPAMICYFSGVDGWVGIALIFLYVLGALIRLAFFNVLEIKRQQKEGGKTKYYRGLPVTSICIILPIIYITKGFLTPEVFVSLLHLMLLVVSILFVLDFKIKKPNFDALLPKRGEQEENAGPNPKNS